MCRRLVLFLMLLSTEAYPQSLVPSWSPDGTQLVFDGYDAGVSSLIYIINADGSNLKILADYGNSPTWTPDGKIYFKGDKGLYAINPDGSGPMTIIEDGISVSPDGQHVLLLHSTGPFTSVLKLSTIDGSRITDLYNFSDTDRLNAPFLWSPDSQKIAFTLAHSQGMSAPVFLAVVPGYGNFSENVNGNFTWAPDSQSIAFNKNDGSTYVFDIDTNKEKLLILDGTGPVWSPDGKKMAFMSRSVVDGTWDIYVQDIEGTERTRLTEDSEEESNFTWSPDGTRIAFMTIFRREGIPGARIHILEVEGKHRITAVSSKSWGEIKSQSQR